MSHLPIIELDIVDSTNNYAMQLIDADKAQHGLTIVAQSQAAGKGQRGKTWIDTPGQSLLMSIVTDPGRPLTDQFAFNASVAEAIVHVLHKTGKFPDIHIKWPNDIIINDKKAGGILIENIIRGNRWTHSVIGLGLNVKQQDFPPDLPYATSLKKASGVDFDMVQLRNDIREGIIACTISRLPADTIMKLYNECLYKRGQQQSFSDGKHHWTATILNALPDGTLQVQLEDGTIVNYHHGQVLWDWE